MSRSPRKLISRAIDALREMDDVLARYPEAEAGVHAAIGESGLAEVRQARDVLVRAGERLSSHPTPTPGRDPESPAASAEERSPT